MAILALVSAKGSPGVTTTALALAAVWPRPVLLAECDPAGGDVLPGFLRGQRADNGLLDVALAARRELTGEALMRWTLPLSAAGEVALLAGLADPAQLLAVDRQWPQIADALAAVERADGGRDVLADCGRLHPRDTPTPVLARARRVLLVVRPSLVSIRAAQSRVGWLRQVLRDSLGTADSLGLLLVGDRPCSPAEIMAALDVPVIAVLADDPDAAAMLSNGTAVRGFARSSLIRSARRAVSRLAPAADRATMVGTLSEAAAW